MQPRMPIPPRMQQGFSGRGPMIGMNRMPQQNPFFRGTQQMNRGGGLLSKILGRGTSAPGTGMNGLFGTQTASRAAAGGGSFLQNLTNPAGISGFLNNTQQVLKTAQTFGPMIQQYGPIVKNLPAMWKLYRGFKNATADTGEGNEEKTAVHGETDAKTSKSSKEKTTKKTSQNSKTKPVRKQQTAGSSKPSIPRENGASVPKLYI
ncbi:VrrA/YqfQ family protein [Bacillota bacterium Lsc_1132]